MRLGSSEVDQAKLGQDKARVANWGAALRPGGDILLYGCDVAKGAEGLQFVDNLAQITGADVAASTNATGAAALGGDWTLEYSTDLIDSAPLFQAASLSGYDELLTGLIPTISGNTVTFTGSAGADTLHLQVSGGALEYQWDGSSTYTTLAGFTLATGTINADLMGGDDTVIFDAGQDFALSGGININAETITVSSGAVISTGAGDVTLTASAQDAAQVTDASQLAAKTASIQVIGDITATSGNVTLTSEVVRNVAVSNGLTDSPVLSLNRRRAQRQRSMDRS